MTAKKPSSGSKDGQRPPDGEIRLSQVITTFGPGAMMDLVQGSVLIGGLDFWRYSKDAPSPAVDEPRLRESILDRFKGSGLQLDPDRPFRLPPAGEGSEPKPWCGIQVAEFPAWFVCQSCRALEHAKNLEKKNNELRHACNRTQLGRCVPVRFVTTCEHGHLDEFPWVRFAHLDRSEDNPCPGAELVLEEGATGDFSQVTVRCTACGAHSHMGRAFNEEILGNCRGRRPWLGRADEDAIDCKKPAQLLLRTASSAYFSQSMSALSIPEPGRELMLRLQEHQVWQVVQVATAATLPTFRTIPAVGERLAGYSDEDVLKAVAVLKGGQPPPRLPLRTAEYQVLMASPLEQNGELPKQDPDPYFFARKLAGQALLPERVSDVVLIKQLRQVRAQVGFTRLSAAVADLQGGIDFDDRIQPLALNEHWLPASELRGEGFLLRLDEALVHKWETSKAVELREKALMLAYDKDMQLRGGGPPFPGARYYLLHSLSHLLMHALSLDCGYAAASLSERIYCAAHDEETPMAALMILTGTPGAEGTLGGLVEQGRNLGRHLDHAFRIGSLCSNDPVCGHHLPDDHSERRLEGAACHGCLYVAECSCERFNRLLDRALVVPTLGCDPEAAFFQVKP